MHRGGRTFKSAPPEFWKKKLRVSPGGFVHVSGIPFRLNTNQLPTLQEFFSLFFTMVSLTPETFKLSKGPSCKLPQKKIVERQQKPFGDEFGEEET